MMQKTWQIVRTELRRKCVLIAASLAVWLLACLAFYLGHRRYYGGLGKGDVPYDIVGGIIYLTIALYMLIFGASLFEAGEKDGIRFFLYHHPVSRFRLYVIRYLTGAAIVLVLSSLTAVLTALIFGELSWSQMLPALRNWVSIAVVFFVFSMLYTAAAFFSPLLATELITVPLALAYGAIAAFGLALLAPGRSLLEPMPLSALWALLAGNLVIFSCGLQLFCKRRILESSWSRRGAVALGFSGITIIVLLVVNFVDFVDLLYLLGIDLMAWG
jgi:ABC-type transport system involved in multi-copper enzyme maturation permease subunit